MSWAKEHGLGEFGRVQAEQNNTDAKRQQKGKESNNIRNNNGATRHKAKRGRKEAFDLPVAPNRAPHERSLVIIVLGLDVGAGGQQMAGHPPVKGEGTD